MEDCREDKEIMYKVDDVVIYGTEGICKIQGLTEKQFGKDTIKYYILSPMDKREETVYVPMKNEKALSKMRHVLSKEAAEDLISKEPQKRYNWIDNDRERQKTYRDILLFGSSEDVLVMARALFFHREKQERNGKKLHAADERFLKDAEKILFEEFAYIFNITHEEVFRLIYSLKKINQK